MGGPRSIEDLWLQVAPEVPPPDSDASPRMFSSESKELSASCSTAHAEGVPGPLLAAKVCSFILGGTGPAKAGGLMTVIEYFISGILYIFQNQMGCHFFFLKEMGDVSVLACHSNHIIPDKQDKGGQALLQGRGKGKGSFIWSLPCHFTLYCCLAWCLVLEPLIPCTVHQPVEDSSIFWPPCGLWATKGMTKSRILDLCT